MSYIKSNIDIAGALASGLCAIHCMALPLLLSFGFAEMISPDSHQIIDLTIFVLSLFVAGYASYYGFKSHERLLPLTGFVLGFMVLTMGILHLSSYSHWLMAAGGIMIAITHYVNYKLLRSFHIH